MKAKIRLFIAFILNTPIMQISLHCRERYSPIYSPQNIRKLSHQIDDRSRNADICCHSERSGRQANSASSSLPHKKWSQKVIHQSITHRINRKHSKSNVPSQAQEYLDIVNRKKCVLRLKHKVKNSSDPLPNLIQIKDCVQECRVNFMRRMDCELNRKGNANLLNNLRKDLNIENRDYLKEMGARIRKDRKFLINLKKEEEKSKEIVFANHSPTTKETSES